MAAVTSDFPKLAPGVDEGDETLIKRGQPLEEFLKQRHGAVQEADSDRANWLNKQRYYLRRRLGMEFRNPTFPWVGSSDVVMPLIDMQIDKLKPAFVNIVYAAPSIVSFVPMLPQSIENARNAERYFNWFLNNVCEDFNHQLSVGVDRMLQYGHVVFKVFHEHRTKNVHETLVRHQLPAGLQAIMVQRGMTTAMADEIYNATQGQVAPLTKQEFDKPEFKKAARDAVLEVFQLNDKIDVDKAAADKVMDFLRNPEKYPDNICTISKREVEYSDPKMVALSPSDFIVPKGCKRVQDASWCCHIMRGNSERMRQQGRDKKWNGPALEELLESNKTRYGSAIVGTLEMDVATVGEGGGEQVSGLQLEQAEDDQFEVRELYCWYDMDKDGFAEKCLITYAPATMGILKAQELPFDHGKWPFVKIDFEQTSDKFYAPRGVPEKLDDLDMEITAQHRGKLNRMMIANAPSFIYQVQGGLNPNQVRWIPGQFYPVLDMNSVAPLQIPVLDMSFDKEEEILRMWAEQHIGGTDFGLHASGSMTEARTAQEIRAIEFNRQQVLSVRGRAFQQGMKQVYDMMWDLMSQWPKPKVWIWTTGSEPFYFDRAQIQGNYDIIPVGSVGESDPTFRAQKALNRLQVLMQSVQILANDPKFELNLGEALLDWLETDDVVRAKAIVRRRSPEEVEQIMRQQQAAQQLAQQVATNQPTDPAVLAMMSDAMAKQLPHKEMQKIQTAAQEVVAGGMG